MSGAAAASEGAAPIRVLFCCDPPYFAALAAALGSLLASNGHNQLEVHLATSRPDPAQEARLADWMATQGVPFQLHRFNWGGRRWPTAFHITQATYIRLFAPRFLSPSVDRVLYLDADLLVLDDLRPLWEIDLGDHAVAAAPDPYGQGRSEALGLAAATPYVNAGVLLMNLDVWRRERVTSQLCRCVEQRGAQLLFHDQDALNLVLAGRILPLDPRWNLQAKALRPRGRRGVADAAALARAASAPAVLHYTTARKPWLFVMPVPGKALYWRSLASTPWAGSQPHDRGWRHVPEFLFNHLVDLIGLDYTWDRFQRATLPGRALARLAQGAARLAERPRAA